MAFDGGYPLQFLKFMTFLTSVKCPSEMVFMKSVQLSSAFLLSAV